MKRYSVFINYGDGSSKLTTVANSPKDAAVSACYMLVCQMQKDIKMDKIEKSTTKKDWTGNWNDWWGTFVEVTEIGTNKVSTYQCTAF